MKPYILVTFFVFLFSNAIAQNGGKVSGTIVNNNQNPVEGSTVSLLRARDSATVKLSVSSKEGLFLFEKLADGKYLISATAVGHQKSYSKIIEVSPQQQTIQLIAISLISVNKDWQVLQLLLSAL